MKWHDNDSKINTIKHYKYKINYVNSFKIKFNVTNECYTLIITMKKNRVKHTQKINDDHRNKWMITNCIFKKISK